ncbi:MAG: hypothetical protein LIP02_00255 [Bacteroidales bacterium]|nr:hypothetical protein [Bacteroidales bacterium]
MKTDHASTPRRRALLRVALAIIMTAVFAPAAMAQYALHNYEGAVKVLRSNQSVAVTKGMALQAPDYIEVPSGGWVEVSSTIGGKTNIYRQTDAGTFKVPQIINNAKRQASDQSSALWNSMSFAKDKKSGAMVYDAAGMVTRDRVSAQAFEPVDSLQLAWAVATALADNKPEIASLLDWGPLRHSENDGIISLDASNPSASPLWVNVLCLTKDEAGNRTVDISTLGQPGANFLLLPGQSMSRRQIMPLAVDGEVHVAVASASPFDLQALISNVKAMLLNGSSRPKSPSSAAAMATLTLD